ncbi:hypothetical protein [Pseudonocardia sp. ICBG1142]|uniref:hypothetical protein n=1 Tax=Pseudonocardia sp. ICBG1142 TaxID=2846760 RepID=UPI001CF70FBC|nr:hypothetical protein [Pseudonocardia sp. ICBG1142]
MAKASRGEELRSSDERVWGPVILQAAESIVVHGIDLNVQDEVETYWDIVFANSYQYAVEEFADRADERLDETAAALAQVLSRGWLGSADVVSPQGVFSDSITLRATQIENPEDDLYGDKPLGAFWTSSYLPNGDSAWSRSEKSEFASLNRKLRNFTFRLPPPRDIFIIRYPEDYRRLVADYPRKLQNGRTVVDWRRASDDYMAVRLTACGLALAHHFRVVTPAGVAWLSGWDAESTAWLHLPCNADLDN